LQLLNQELQRLVLNAKLEGNELQLLVLCLQLRVELSFELGLQLLLLLKLAVSHYFRLKRLLIHLFAAIT